MLRTGGLREQLYISLADRAEESLIEEVRIGLGYAGVKLNDNRMGLAAILLNDLPPGCSINTGAGQLADSSASRLLKHLVEGKNPVEKALGLATANAIISPAPPEEEQDAIGLIGLNPLDRVAMVGYFPPLVPKIKATGAVLTVIEKNPARGQIFDRQAQQDILSSCTVAVITATTLLNDTLEEILNSLRRPRHVAILGPSTPLYPQIFQSTPVGHLGGAAITDTAKVMQAISEGGGTPAMRPYLRFINVLLSRKEIPHAA